MRQADYVNHKAIRDASLEELREIITEGDVSAVVDAAIDELARRAAERFRLDNREED